MNALQGTLGFTTLIQVRVNKKSMFCPAHDSTRGSDEFFGIHVGATLPTPGGLGRERLVSQATQALRWRSCISARTP
jgi:hypothetical protein